MSFAIFMLGMIFHTIFHIFFTHTFSSLSHAVHTFLSGELDAATTVFRRRAVPAAVGWSTRRTSMSAPPPLRGLEVPSPAPSPMDEVSPDFIAHPSPITLADFISPQLLQTSPKKHLYHKHSSRIKNNRKPASPQIVGNPMKMNLRSRKKLSVVPEDELLTSVAVVHKDLGSKNVNSETEIGLPSESESHPSFPNLVRTQTVVEGHMVSGERNALFSFPPVVWSPEVVEAGFEALLPSVGGDEKGVTSSILATGICSPSKVSSTVRKKIAFPVIFAAGKNGAEQTGGDTHMVPHEETVAHLQLTETCQEVSRADAPEMNSISVDDSIADDVAVLLAGVREVTSVLPIRDEQQSVKEAGLVGGVQVAEKGSPCSPTLESHHVNCLSKISNPAHSTKGESTLSALFPSFWCKEAPHDSAVV